MGERSSAMASAISARSFRADTVVLGASADTVALNQKFTDKENYNFPLLCDRTRNWSPPWESSRPDGNSDRVTYMVDREGKIAKIFDPR